MKSVQYLLQSGLLALLLACFLVLYAINDHLAHIFVDDMVWQQLGQKVEWIRQNLNHDILNDSPDLPNHTCQEPTGSGMYCQWQFLSNSHEILHLSPSLEGVPIRYSRPALGNQVEIRTLEHSGQEIMVVVRSFMLAGGELVVAAGQAQSLHNPLLRKWRSLFLLIFLLAFVGFSFLFYWYTKLSFDGFRRLNDEVMQLKSGKRHRLNSTGPAETGSLTALVDSLLVKEERHIQRIRRSLSHMAHSLKIPVTALVHVADRMEQMPLPKLRAILVEQTRLLEQLIEGQLRRASLAEKTLGGERFHLGREIPSLVRALEGLHYEKEIDLQVMVPEALLCPGNRDDMLELIGNLADNACKWAKARVVLAAGNEGGFWLTIEDDGSGVEDARLALLRQGMGVPSDEARHGHGMGLRIAQDIVDLYGGEISFGRSPELGGFMVRVLLP